MITTYDRIRDALRKCGLDGYARQAPFIEAIQKPEVIKAIEAALEAKP